MANKPSQPPSPGPDNGTGIWRSAAALGLIAVLGTGVLALVHEVTRERIAEQEQRTMSRQLNEILDRRSYDNSLHEDVVTVRDATAFPGGQTVRVYRARRDGEPVAAVLWLGAPDGYNGWIDLLVGVTWDGVVTGVRVTWHNETPGLGDGIETARSDWVHAFAGRSLSDPPPARWKVRKEGGDFDQFTGATITPRAVVNAVARALAWFGEHRDTLFARPAEESAESAS
ncbi:electron transport complex subunit RsxG [Elongatibacter sediminis]|uniref:Ion-translocating oxidoreductase complex subunit G n=1 Tax=Elongatibacter sediminis TaxID=3119006 RepID=A0AAW9R7V8_9GAMM